MNTQLTARTEFAAAINQICTERGIAPEVVIDSIKTALIASFRKDYPEKFQELEDQELVIEAKLDQATGEFRLYSGKEGDPVKKMTDITPVGFGRIAAQTAKQVILQKIREAEKDATVAEYRDKIGELINGMVLRLDGKNVVVDLGRGQGYMPPEEQVKNEYYRLNARFSFLISDIRETHRGMTIIVSRSDPRLVERLFAREVPEVSNNAVTVKAISREAGFRTKIAVDSTQEGVDPVGSCVGQKGVRVQAVINELNGEKIDIVPYSDKLEEYIKAALSPAEGLKVNLDKANKAATVVIPQDQLSLAIGRGGQNVRLAAKLTQTSIKITSDQSDVKLTVTGDEEFEIDQLGLSTKVRNVLIKAKLTRIEDLNKNTDILKNVKGLGKQSLDQIKTLLQAYQPALKPQINPETTDKAKKENNDSSNQDSENNTDE